MDSGPALAAARAVRGRSRSRARLAFLRRVVSTRGGGFGVAVLVALLLVAATVDVLAPYDPNQPGVAGILAAPDLHHLMGTDQLGRDVLSRLLYGARVSVESGVISVGFALLVGVLMGLVAGYVGGWTDDLLMRLVDALYSFPTLVLALAIGASLGPGLRNAMLAIGIVFTPAFARLVRGQTLSLRERDFVLAARMLGARPWRIMLRHIGPNVTGPIVVQASLMVGAAIVTEAALSFLGLGVEPPAASWGSMLKAGYQYLDRAPWLSLAPGVVIFVTVLAFNLLGDGLRRALDPHLWQRGQS
jgi:peptide/nickel transport system permease protein